MAVLENTAASTTKRRVRWAGWLGFLTAVAFPVLVLIAGTQFSGYSHVGQKISELGGIEATSPWIQNTNFWMLGLGAIAIAWGLSQEHGRAILGAVLVAAFGVLATWMNAIFPCDAGCAGQTPSGLAHNVTGASGFVAVTVAMFLLPRIWDGSDGWENVAWFTRVIRPVTVAGFVWFIGTQALDAQTLSGIAQRVFAGSVITWLALLGWRLAHP